MTPLVSVIIATRDRPGLLRLALASVSGQHNVPGLVETIVVNDGGADVTGPVNAATGQGMLVRLVDLTVNRGLPAARNAGLGAAQGEFVAFLDDDDVFLPDHLALMLAAIEQQGADAAYGGCAVSTTRVDPARPSFSRFYWSCPFDAELLSVANFIPVHAPVLRRLPEAARFDTGLPALEDWDMWLRLIRDHGYRFHHVPEPTVVYHRIPGQDSMVGTTISDSAALAGFGNLAQRIWARWPAATPRARRFRLYIAVMYWHALALLAQGQQLNDNYFLRCVDQIAAVWRGEQPEDSLPERIIDSIKDSTHAGTPR